MIARVGWALAGAALLVLVAGVEVAIGAGVVVSAAAGMAYGGFTRLALADLLLRAALVLMVGVPVLWLFANRTLLGEVSPALVTEAPWPSRVAAMALALATAGLLLQVLGSGRHDDD